jgi:hypothetical protein
MVSVPRFGIHRWGKSWKADLRAVLYANKNKIKTPEFESQAIDKGLIGLQQC